jgi:hypothetical protein
MTNQNPYSAGSQPAEEATMSFCPKCGHAVDIPLPVDPLYSVETTAVLVPTTIRGLIQWASKHKSLLDTPYYKKSGPCRYRLFSARDVRTIRNALVSRSRWRPKLKAFGAMSAQESTDGRHT